MTITELKEYRRVLEKEFADKDLEIETQLSYISIGSLGFFITINEKFITIQSAGYKSILIVSLIFLFISFVLVLIRKSRTSHHDLLLMEFVDKMHPDSKEQDRQLLSKWDCCHKELTKILLFIYITLTLGIGMQVLFVVLNV